MEYTHKALIKAGYARAAPDPFRGVGFVRYGKGGLGYPENQVVFVGNNATMEGWTEKHWKQLYPDVYKWWTDPTNRGPHTWRGWGGQWEFVFIKGEDPKLEEGQDGSQDSEPGI